MNSKKHKGMDWYATKQRFSIRKYHFGVASVLLGAVLATGTVAIQNVQADETTVSTVVANTENQVTTDETQTSELQAQLASSESQTLPVLTESTVEIGSEVSSVTELVSEPEVLTEDTEYIVESEKASSGVLVNANDSLGEVQTPMREEIDMMEEEVISEGVEAEISELPVLSEEASKEIPQKKEIVDTSLQVSNEVVVSERLKIQKNLQETALVKRRDERDLYTTTLPTLRSVTFRASQSSDEVQVYSQVQSFSDKPGGTISDFKGYVVKSAHTPTTDNIRFEFDYTPTIAAGRTTEVPFVFGIGYSANFKLVQNSLKVNGQTVPYYKSDNGSEWYWSSSQKVRIGQKNRVEFVAQAVTEKIHYSNVNPTIGTANTGNYNRFFYPLSGDAIVRNTTTGTVKFDAKTFQETIEEIEGPKLPEPKVETSAIPFTTEYKADESLEVNTQATEREGVDGEQTVTTTYKKEGTEIVETKGEPVVTKEPVAKIVKVGTKPTVVTETIEFKTVYQDDPSMNPTDPEVLVTEGKAGQKTTTTTYRLDEKTGTVTPNTPTEEVVAAVDRVVRRGVGQESKIAFETTYVANENLEAGQQEVVTEGVEGTRHPNGEVLKEPVTKVVQVGTKPKIEVTAIAFETIYEEDPNMKATDPEVVLVEGQNGEIVVTTTYTLDTKTGTLSENEPTEKVTAPVNRVVKRGVGQETTIPYKTVYQADETLEAGEKQTKTQGVTGVMQPDGSISKQAVDELILVGTKPKVVEEMIAYETFYEANDEQPLGDERIKNTGVKGLIVTTTTYTLDTTTGNVTASEPVSETVRKVINRIVRLGTKPTEKETAIAYETEYVTDDKMGIDDPEVVVQEGQAGKRVVTTTYKVDKTTGAVTPDKEVETSTPAVNKIVKRGVGKETIIPYNTFYEADETLNVGERVVTKKGELGLRHPNGVITKTAVSEYVKVGTKPTVSTEVIVYKTVYQDDPTMKTTDPVVLVTKGQDGLKTSTVTYTLDTMTGNVIAQAPQVTTTPAVDEVIKRGVGEDTVLSYATVYVANDKLDYGKRQTVTKGETGLRHPNGTVTKAAVDEVIAVGTKPEVTEESLAYKVIYQDDPTMKVSEPQVVLVKGQDGLKVTTVTYTLDTKTGDVTQNTPDIKLTAAVDEVIKRGVGEDTVLSYATVYVANDKLDYGKRQTVTKGETGLRHPNGTVTKAAVDEVIAVGTKPEVTEESLAYKVIYQDDPTMKVSEPQVVLVKGQDGLKVTTVTYTLDTKTGDVTQNTPDIKLTEAVDEVIKRGVGEDTVLPYDTLYVANTAVDRDVRVVKQAGQHGLRHPNGTVTKEPVTLIIEVGTKPTVVEETLDFITVYQNDASMKASEPEVLVKEGVLGKKISTTNYTLNEKTGEVSLSPVQVELIPAVNRIVKRGIGEDTVLPYETSYIADETMAVGRRQLVTKGENGVRHPNGTVTKEAVTEVVRIGTEPITNLEKLPYKTIYQDDATMKADDPEVIVVAGKTGLKTTVTTFTLDTKTGDVTANEPHVLTVDAVDEVIKRGVGEDTLLPYKTVFVANAELDYGIRNVVVEGIEGIRHPNGSITREVVNEVIEVGVKPHITEEILAHKTIYQDDPTMSVNDPDVIVVEGVDGKRIIKVTYLLNEETGEVTAQVSEQLIAPIDEVIKRGICEPAPLPEPCPAPITEPCPTPMVEVVEEQEAPVVAEMLPETGDDNSAAAVGVGAILLGMIGLSGISGRKKSEE
ncbi:G5 domain-containing protein [Streptococcus sp. zg-JUN1979]|uniref:G5 domain-containing protein n=1 Tax=Streptococcus sp. zg-JUN1979 TaxID=3391450 RepID=UPI0039A618F8